MSQNRSRKIVIGVLASVTILLLGVAVFIALRLQTPDVSVAECGPSEIFCGGCINGCKPNTKTCNAWIDDECGGNQCQGNGQTCGSGCCAGLTCCPNGRCGSGCGIQCAPEGQSCNGVSCCSGLSCQGGVCRGQTQPSSSQCTACTSYTYSAWSACSTNGTQTRTITGRNPGSCTVNCAGSATPILSRACSGVSSGTPVSGGVSSAAGDVQSCGSGTWTYSGNCIQVVTGSCSLQRFSGSGCPTVTNNDGTATEGVGTYCPSPAQGSCQQVDVVGSGQGVCSCANGTTTTVRTSQTAYTCTQMTRLPNAAELAPNQVISVTVRETSTTANNNSNIFILDGSSAVVATGTRTSGPTLSGTNTYTHVFSITVPANAANGSYTIRYSRTGQSTALEAATACQSAFTVSQDAPQLATVSVLKSSSHACEVGGGATVNYTVTLTNNSATAATINSVSDVLPAQVTASSQVQNANPAASSITGDTITWNGPFTLNAGANLVFTYSLVFSDAQMQAFTSNELTNTVTVTYGTENSTATFTLLTVMSCLPATGLFDEPAGLILVGLILILAGILVNRSGLLLNLFGANMRSSDATSKLVESFINTEEVQGDRFSRGVMQEQEKKYSRGKK